MLIQSNKILTYLLLISTIILSTIQVTSSSPSSKKCLYSTLSIPKNASSKEITKAYRKLALKYHPDKVSPNDREKAEQKFKEIGYAHDILSDETKRKRYDLYGEKGLDENFIPGGGMGGMGGMGGAGFTGAGAGAGGGSFGGMNMNDFFQMNQEQYQGSGGGSSSGSTTNMFHNMGGGGMNGSNSNSEGFQIDLSEILQGMMGMRHPANAAGNNHMGMGFGATGAGAGGPSFDSGMGSGFNTRSYYNNEGMDQSMFHGQQQQQQQQQRPKYTNKSKPSIQSFTCTLSDLSNPNGTTKKLKVKIGSNEKIYTINIQPGWKDGTKIKFKASKDGLFPPMTFVMKERKHKFIIRNGNDLIYNCTVTEKQAEKAVKIKVPIPGGDMIEIVTKPDEITSGYEKVIDGKGMPTRNPNDSNKQRGDFIVSFKIVEKQSS